MPQNWEIIRSHIEQPFIVKQLAVGDRSKLETGAGLEGSAKLWPMSEEWRRHELSFARRTVCARPPRMHPHGSLDIRYPHPILLIGTYSLCRPHLDLCTRWSLRYSGVPTNGQLLLPQNYTRAELTGLISRLSRRAAVVVVVVPLCQIGSAGCKGHVRSSAPQTAD